jgi:hypothetical protein
MFMTKLPVTDRAGVVIGAWFPLYRDETDTRRDEQ